MFKLFKEDWENLNSDISNLKSKISFASGMLRSYNRERWEEIFDLCKEIQKTFKHVRYPTKKDRNIAWQRFCDLRNSAYSEKNTQFVTLSNNRKNEINNLLRDVDYDWFADILIGQILSLGFLKTKVEDMKWAGKKLKEAGTYFKSVKYDMTREDKSYVHDRLVEIRSNHDLFWSRYKDSAEKNYQQRREEKNREWVEKREKSLQIRQGIENNISHNKSKLYKAQDALERTKDKRRDLKNKIEDSYNDNWKSKAEGWLEEFDDKIEDIEESIKRLEQWIYNDQDKLDNWN